MPRQDLGFNDIGYRNTSDLSSPNIDALALAGVRLDRYYTHNLCSPSRTSFLVCPAGAQHCDGALRWMLPAGD